MTTDAKAVAQQAVDVVLDNAAFVRQAVRAVGARDGVLVIVQVVPTGGTLFTVADERRTRRPPARGERCRQDIMGVVREARRPLLGPAIAAKLKGKHSASGVKKALAELTTAGELVNDDDGRGYRLPGQVAPPETGSLFD